MWKMFFENIKNIISFENINISDFMDSYLYFSN
jgi:hypothetical protein